MSLWACLLQDAVSTLLLLSCEEHASVRYHPTSMAFLKVDFAPVAVALWVGFCRSAFDILTQTVYQGAFPQDLYWGKFYKAGLWPDTQEVFKSGVTGS